LQPRRETILQLETPMSRHWDDDHEDGYVGRDVLDDADDGEPDRWEEDDDGNVTYVYADGRRRRHHEDDDRHERNGRGHRCKRRRHDRERCRDIGEGRPGGAKERWTIHNNFVDFSLRHCTRAEIAVWWVLFRDSKRGAVTASMDQLADRAGCSHQAVVEALHGKKRLPGSGLVTKGLVVIAKTGKLLEIKKDGTRRGRSSRYRVFGLISTKWMHRYGGSQ
jgi:hypothetical protein